MAKAGNNILLRGVSGRIGGLIVRQMRDGSIRLSAPPDFSNRRFSQAQKDQQQRFKQAAAYARQAIQTHPIYAELARKTRQAAYNLAVSDWFHPPVIHSLERTGDTLRVEASDNVMVARIHVQILDEEGRVLEEGEASRADPEMCPELWHYIAHTQGRVLAQAWDLAGNGKTVVKATYGWFNHTATEDFAGNYNQNTRVTYRYRWRDLNGNRGYDPGEVNLDPNGPDFVAISTGTPRIPNPNEKQPYTDEFSVSVERQLVQPKGEEGLALEPKLMSQLAWLNSIVASADVMTLDEALDLANRTEYGLTAGIYSDSEDDLNKFFERIQTGVTYANRRAGATTGAWPGINSFGGWKASGSTGRGTGGPYYVQQFMREQSRVRIRGV